MPDIKINFSVSDPGPISPNSKDSTSRKNVHRNPFREDFKKKTEKSDIVQKGRVGWTPKPNFLKE